MKWTNKGHQLDYIGKHFADRKKIYIYGAGKLGEELFSYLEFLDCVEAFIDQDEYKQKKDYCGVKVISPKEFLRLSKDDHIIIIAASITNTLDILTSLLSKGYLECINCFTMDRFMAYYLPIYSVYALNKIYFDSAAIHPSTLCNLNCEHCLNFNPYIEHHTIKSLNEMKKNVDCYFSRVDYTIRFQICGGEPTLYPHLAELIQYIGKKYKNQICVFEIVTNATILPSEELCQILKEYGVLVYLDDYTEALPEKKHVREAIIKKFYDFNINFIDNKVDIWFDLCPMTTDNSYMDEKSLIEYHDKCQVPWIEIRDCKVYHCSFSSFAMKAGLNVETENDYLNLQDITNENKKELLEFRRGYTEKGYLDFCKCCAGCHTINKNFVPVAKQAIRNKRDKH